MNSFLNCTSSNNIIGLPDLHAPIAGTCHCCVASPRYRQGEIFGGLGKSNSLGLFYLPSLELSGVQCGFSLQ